MLLSNRTPKKREGHWSEFWGFYLYKISRFLSGKKIRIPQSLMFYLDLATGSGYLGVCQSTMLLTAWTTFFLHKKRLDSMWVGKECMLYILAFPGASSSSRIDLDWHQEHPTGISYPLLFLIELRCFIEKFKDLYE